MKYLIIGGAGIFALHTIKKILNLKDTLKVVSVGRNRERSSEAFTLGVGKNDNRYTYKQIHLSFEIDFLTDLIDSYEPDYIINFAALAYATSWNKSSRYYDTNITAVAKLCEHLYGKKYLKQFLQIGSSEVYGGTDKPAKENNNPNPTSPYAVSKLAADYHMLSLYNHMGFPANVIRPSNCYGSGQYMYRVIPKAILFGLIGKKFPLEGGGKALKSFMHAQDLADAIISILHSNKFGRIYNAGVEKPNSIREIVETVSNNLKLDFNNFCVITEGRKTEDKQYCIDSSYIKKELGWEAKITLDDGIDEVVQWVKKYKEILIKEPQNFTLRA